MRSIILPELGHLKAYSINSERIDDYVNKRLRTPVTVRKGTKSNPRIEPVRNPDGQLRLISRSTVRREIDNIQAVLNWAVEEKFISHNPIARKKRPTRNDTIIKPPTIKEVRGILQHADPQLYRLLGETWLVV